MPRVPEIISLDSPFETPVGDWSVEEKESPSEFALNTCVRYSYRFTRPKDGEVEEREIIILIPKDEIEDEHREDEVREMIRSRLVYSDEAESVLNPYGCPLE